MFSSIFKKGKAASGNRPEKAKPVASVLGKDNNKKKFSSRGGSNHYDDVQPMLLELEENERFGRLINLSVEYNAMLLKLHCCVHYRYDSITNRWSFRFLLPTDPKRYSCFFLK